MMERIEEKMVEGSIISLTNTEIFLGFFRKNDISYKSVL